MRPKTAARAAFLLAAAVLLVLTVVREWDAVAESLSRLGVLRVLASGVVVVVALGAQMLSWRALLADGPGAPLPVRAAARIYFLGQLGKYVPGAIWTVVAQAELGRDHQLSRARSAVVALGALAVLAVTGAAVGAAGLAAGSTQALRTYWWAFLAVPVGVALLHPAVLNRLIALAQRLARRSGEVPALSGRALLRSAAWALVQWLLLGVHAWLLAADLGASGWADTATVTGAFALAWVVGLVVVIAPAGAGAREAALVLALAPVLAGPEALVLALVSRVLMVVGDAVVALVVVRRAPPA